MDSTAVVDSTTFVLPPGDGAQLSIMLAAVAILILGIVLLRSIVKRTAPPA